MSIEEQIDKQGIDGCPDGGRSDDGATRRLTAQLQPVQRGVAGQRRAARTPCPGLPGEDGKHRIVAQLVMIDQMLAAERDADDTLR